MIAIIGHLAAAISLAVYTSEWNVTKVSDAAGATSVSCKDDLDMSTYYYRAI